VVVVRGFLSFVLDTLHPALCIHCGAELADEGPLSVGAFARGWPSFASRFFQGDGGARMLCCGCWTRLAPAFSTKARMSVPPLEQDVPVLTPFFTNETLLSLIRFLKFGDGTPLAPRLSWWMARALEPAIAGTLEEVLLVPVPLHWTRSWSRGYNQGALLARCVARELGVGISERILFRCRRTRRQAKLDDRGRRSNVRGAFRRRAESSIRGAHIVLVDDLVTSGETARACLEALLDGAPQSLTVLAAGRRSHAG
jgi:ComF family protein